MRLSLPPACRHGPEQGMRPLGFPFDALERLQLLDIQGVQFCLRAPKHALNTHSYRWAQKLNVWPRLDLGPSECTARQLRDWLRLELFFD